MSDWGGVFSAIIILAAVSGAIWAVLNGWRETSAEQAIAQSAREAPVAISSIQHRVEMPQARERSSHRAITAGGVFWSVFGALWLYTITAAIVYAFIHVLNS